MDQNQMDEGKANGNCSMPTNGGGGISGDSMAGGNCTPISKNRICRDFVRGTCRRVQCRFPHVLTSDQVVFCHDYQNNICQRNNCKFLHYSLSEEEHYRKFGEFSSMDPASKQDYIECEYGMGRYREWVNGNNNGNLPNGQSNAVRWQQKLQMPPPLSQNPRELIPSPPPLWGDRNYRGGSGSPMLHDYNRSPRNSLVDSFSNGKRSISNDTLGSFKRYRADNGMGVDTQHTDLMGIIRRLEEEQVMMRRRVETNEIKIAELRASNDYLIAQNTHLRLNNVQQNQQQQHQQNQSQQSQQNQTQQQQTVTVQTTTQSQVTPSAVMTAVSIAPVQVQATPIVSIATPPTQIIANTTPALAIAAANTSQGQQLTIATAQQGQQHAPQILGTSQITLAPAALAQGLTINTSQPLAMSNATQPIISYPVMTHSILPH